MQRHNQPADILLITDPSAVLARLIFYKGLIEAQCDQNHGTFNKVSTLHMYHIVHQEVYYGLLAVLWQAQNVHTIVENGLQSFQWQQSDVSYLGMEQELLHKECNGSFRTQGYERSKYQ